MADMPEMPLQDGDTSSGAVRDLAVHHLQLACRAVQAGDTRLITEVATHVQVVSADGTSDSVVACTCVALGLIDRWLCGRDSEAPADLAGLAKLPAGQWAAANTAASILALAGEGRALGSREALTAEHGELDVLYGSMLALGASLLAWSRQSGIPIPALVRTAVR
jgi:hypothetical protein